MLHLEYKLDSLFYKCIDAFCWGRPSEGLSRFRYWTILSCRNVKLNKRVFIIGKY